MHIALTVDDVHELVKEKYRIHHEFTISVEPVVVNPDTHQHSQNIVDCPENDVPLMDKQIWYSVPTDWNYDVCPHHKIWGVTDLEVEVRDGVREICRSDTTKYSWVQTDALWDIVKYREI